MVMYVRASVCVMIDGDDDDGDDDTSKTKKNA